MFAVGAVALLALILAPRTTAGPPDSASLVKDISVGPSGSSSPNAEPDRVAVGGFVYFVADDGSHGRELWKTDGTSAGTTMVSDIDDNGSDGSDPRNLAVLDGEILFSADDGDVGRELWKTDGTSAGTVLVKDIRDLGANGSSPDSLTRADDHLYFSALDGKGLGDNGRELWKTDGTEAGTVLVEDINPGSSNSSSPRELADVDGPLDKAPRCASCTPMGKTLP